jgi:hypothetical protein
MKRFLLKISDYYIKRPLLWDILICTLIICTVHYSIEIKKIIQLNVDAESLKSNLSDIIATSISLAGFVLASLTIIVTFKENITQKQNSIAQNQTDGITNPNTNITGIELLFTSVHYGRIVGVFSWAAFILLSLFVIISMTKMFTKCLSINELFYASIIGITIIALTIFRSLLVLYAIIKLQLKRA